MSDRYRAFATSAAGRAIVSLVGLPDPAGLRPYRPGEPIVAAPVLLGGGDRLRAEVAAVLAGAGVEVVGAPTAAGLAGLVYDGTGLREPAALRALYDFVQPAGAALARSGRVIVLGTPPQECRTPAEAAAQQGLAGFVEAAGRALGRAIVAQVVYVAAGAEDMTESTLRFLLSSRSACASGQRIGIAHGVPLPGVDWLRPLTGQVALVTAASHGIGAAIATVLARDGAHVVCVDHPATGEALASLAQELGGTALAVEPSDAPRRIADELTLRHAGVDVIVHSAARQPLAPASRAVDPARGLDHPDGAAQWDHILELNLAAPERLNSVLLGEKILRMGGRIVTVAAMAGPAATQSGTHGATAAAGLVGLVQAQARTLTKYSVTANAVTPRHTDSTVGTAVPGLTRAVARRWNDLTPGGLAPVGLAVHVAETVGWLASPASGGVTGNLVEVRGRLVPEI